MRRCDALAAALSLAGVVAGPPRACAETGPTPPAITSVRYDEDYAAYRDASARHHRGWARPAFLPLDDADPTGAYATFGLEARVRYERLDNDGFGSGPQDGDGIGLTRLIPTASMHVPLAAAGTARPPELRVFTQLIVAHELGSDTPPGPVNEDRGDLLQAFAELGLPLALGNTDARATLRAGRRSFKLGSERLVGTRYGVNVPRPFDGFFLTLADDRHAVEAFWARPVRNDPDSWDDTADDDRSLWGLYASHDLRHTPANGETDRLALDTYYLGFLDTASVFAQNPGDPRRERRHTAGARLFGQTPLRFPEGHAAAFDFNTEAFLQFGRFGGADLFAWSLAADIGLTLDAAGDPRLGLKANLISGDDDPDDPDLQTFNPLFPRGTYFGELSPVGPYNLINAQASLAVSPAPGWRVTAQGGPFFRHRTTDGVYDVPGNLVRAPDPTTDAREIGWQWELLAEAALADNLDLLVSYGQFHPGEFLKDTDASATTRLLAVELRWRF